MSSNAVTTNTMTSTKLTVHVLDMAQGASAQGMRLQVQNLQTGAVHSATTGADGRVAGAIIEGADFAAGKYRLTFELEAYYASSMQNTRPTDAFFMPQALIEFNNDGRGNYHIPLVITPWSYSVYRGS